MKAKIKKIGIYALFSLVVASIGLASWLIVLSSGGITANVVAEQGGTAYVSTSFSDYGIINTTDGSKTVNQTAIIQNTNSPINFSVQIIEDRIDVNDSCTNYENDLTAVYKINGVEITDGEMVTLEAGESTIESELTAVSHSCPQEYTAEVILTEV